MTKLTIKLRPKTRRLEPNELGEDISAELVDRLEEISTDSKKATTQVDLGYFRPKKKQISIRMDADVLAWFQSQPGKYQQLINKACREFMERS